MRKLAAPVLCAGAVFYSAAAFGEGLRFPVDCDLGVNCVIQQYVDRNPGPGALDFTCGPLSYDGHKGTDIRLMDQAAMRAGVDVISATDGVVRGLRDGMPDIRQGQAGAPDVSGRECGNGVVVERANGWTLQYCHLLNGSVRVQKGQSIKAGAVLGQIGLSGSSEFPHLHVTVRDRDGTVVDPFDARPQDSSCQLPETETLWAADSKPDYRPGGALTAGFSDRVPDYDDIRQGTANLQGLTDDSPALVFWAHFFGLRKNDTISLIFTGPDGEISRSTHDMTRNRAVQFRAAGRKRSKPWAKGNYVGTASLLRAGRQVDTIERSVQIK